MWEEGRGRKLWKWNIQRAKSQMRKRKLIQVYWFLQDFLRIIFCSSSWIDKLYLQKWPSMESGAIEIYRERRSPYQKKEKLFTSSFGRSPSWVKNSFSVVISKKKRGGRRRDRKTTNSSKSKVFSAPAHSPTRNMHPNKMKLGKQKNNKSLCGPIHGHILRMLHAWNKKRKTKSFFFPFWTEFVFSFVGASTSWVTFRKNRVWAEKNVYFVVFQFFFIKVSLNLSMQMKIFYLTFRFCLRN